MLSSVVSELLLNFICNELYLYKLLPSKTLYIEKITYIHMYDDKVLMLVLLNWLEGTSDMSLTDYV